MDEARADFENGNAVGGETIGEHRRRHAQTGLGDAVFRAGRRRGVGGNRSNKHNRGFRSGILPGLLEHAPRDLLGQEHGSAQIDAEHPVIARRAHFQHIQPLRGCHSGIVHQHIEAAVFHIYFIEHPLVIVERCDVALQRQEPAAEVFDALFDL